MSSGRLLGFVQPPQCEWFLRKVQALRAFCVRECGDCAAVFDVPSRVGPLGEAGRVGLAALVALVVLVVLLENGENQATRAPWRPWE